MTNGLNLQVPFLEALRAAKTPLAVYLVNGIKLTGYVESFDDHVILLQNSVGQMVYKHAISTIVPSSAVDLTALHQAAVAAETA